MSKSYLSDKFVTLPRGAAKEIRLAFIVSLISLHELRGFGPRFVDCFSKTLKRGAHTRSRAEKLAFMNVTQWRSIPRTPAIKIESASCWSYFLYCNALHRLHGQISHAV